MGQIKVIAYINSICYNSYLMSIHEYSKCSEAYSVSYSPDTNIVSLSSWPASPVMVPSLRDAQKRISQSGSCYHYELAGAVRRAIEIAESPDDIASLEKQRSYFIESGRALVAQVVELSDGGIEIDGFGYAQSVQGETGAPSSKVSVDSWVSGVTWCTPPTLQTRLSKLALERPVLDELDFIPGISPKAVITSFNLLSPTMPKGGHIYEMRPEVVDIASRVIQPAALRQELDVLSVNQIR